MSSDNLSMKRVLFVLHYGRGGKRWNDEGVMSILVNGQDLQFVVKDDVTYAMMSLSQDKACVSVETVYVDNWGILKHFYQSVNVMTDVIVTIDLVCKKCVVTEHHLSDSDFAVLCKMILPLTTAEYRRTEVLVSGCCSQLGKFDPQDAPEAVKIPNGTFLYAVPKCQCDETDEYHNMYKFVSNGCHRDPDAFRATTDGLMWEGPTDANRESPDLTEFLESEETFPLLIGQWGFEGNTLLEIPVTLLKKTVTQKPEIKHMNYAQLKKHWAFTNEKCGLKSAKPIPNEKPVVSCCS